METVPLFISRLAHQLAELAAAKARPLVASKSRTLGRLLRVVDYPPSRNKARSAAYIPHYWAIYVHDGRGTFAAPAGKYLIWFRDPRNDPRHRGNYVERLSEKRTLTKQDFEFWLGENRRVIEQYRKTNKDLPLHLIPVPMIVVERVRKGVAPANFFDNGIGMAGFGQQASGHAQAEFSKHVQDQLGELLHIKDSCVVRL